MTSVHALARWVKCQCCSRSHPYETTPRRETCDSTSPGTVGRTEQFSLTDKGMQLSKPVDHAEWEGWPCTADPWSHFWTMAESQMSTLVSQATGSIASKAHIPVFFSHPHRISPSYHLFFSVPSSPHYSISSPYFTSNLFPVPNPDSPAALSGKAHSSGSGDLPVHQSSCSLVPLQDPMQDPCSSETDILKPSPVLLVAGFGMVQSLLLYSGSCHHP